MITFVIDGVIVDKSDPDKPVVTVVKRSVEGALKILPSRKADKANNSAEITASAIQQVIDSVDDSLDYITRTVENAWNLTRRVEEAAGKAETSEGNAAGSATAAAESAKAAELAFASAVGYAGNAEAFARNAEAFAGNADQSANNAYQSEVIARQHREAAAEYATQAKDASESANGAAIAAEQFMRAAQGYADDAQNAVLVDKDKIIGVSGEDINVVVENGIVANTVKISADIKQGSISKDKVDDTIITEDDVASTSKAGIVKIFDDGGLAMHPLSGDGGRALGVVTANDVDILGKEHHFRPIAPVNFDFAVAQGTHQSMSDEYDVSKFNTCYQMRGKQGQLPVSYDAVKRYVNEKIENVEPPTELPQDVSVSKQISNHALTLLSDKKHLCQASGVEGMTCMGMWRETSPVAKKIPTGSYVYLLLSDGAYHLFTTKLPIEIGSTVKIFMLYASGSDDDNLVCSDDTTNLTIVDKSDMYVVFPDNYYPNVGDVPGAEVFNDYEANTTNVPYAHIEGRNNKAKLKTFLIKSISYGDKEDSVTLTPANALVSPSKLIKAGMTWNIFTESGGIQYKYNGVVTRVSGNNVYTAKGKLPSTLTPSTVGSFLGTFIVSGGSVGDREITDYTGDFSVHVEGRNNEAALDSHAEGTETKAIAYSCHAEGRKTTASGECSHAEGFEGVASGDCSHVEGAAEVASGHYSHAEGYKTKATGAGSHAEGNMTEASSKYAHAEGQNTHATGVYSHTEGQDSVAEGYAAHAEGFHAQAMKMTSHAEGYECISGADHSHAEGYRTSAMSDNQHVQGKYNIEDASGTYAHIVGNGNKDSKTGVVTRSNAHTLDWSGNAWYEGYVEATAIILKSPNGSRYEITVDDSGNLQAKEVS